MSMIFTNNAGSKLAEAITAAATSLKILTADVAEFPTLTSGKYFYLTLVGDGVYEVVKCTATSSNTFTVVRAQDGTTAQAWPAETLVELRMPAVALNEMVEGIDSKAPINHASTATTYGIGATASYGHVRLSDDVTSTSNSATGGMAATPAAVKKAYDKAASAATAASTAQSSAEDAQATADSAVTKAEAAQTTANTAVTMATGSVKSVNSTLPDASGNVALSIDAFPAQADNAGKFLTTDGTTVSWGDIPDAGPWTELAEDLTTLDDVKVPGWYVPPKNGFSSAITYPHHATTSTIGSSIQYDVATDSNKKPEFRLHVAKVIIGGVPVNQNLFINGYLFTRRSASSSWGVWSYVADNVARDSGQLGFCSVRDTSSITSYAPYTLSAHAIHELVDNIPSVTLSDAVNSESTTVAASSKAAKTAYDKAVEAYDKAIEASSGSSATAGVPCGTIIYSGSTTTPSGYLKCDGSEVSRETYADLFAAIGAAYGAGDGTSTFNLPNLMNVFVEGNATPGTHLTAGLPNITGSMKISGSSGGFDAFSGALSQGSSGGTVLTANGTAAANGAVILNASLSSSIYGNSTTVQPESYTAIPYIKAFGAVVNEGSVDVSKFIRTINGTEPDAAGNINIDTSLPLGTIIWSADSTVPEGYLLCDGSAVNRTTYASLFNIIGTTYGAGNGTTTFNLPNLIDKFIEGSATAGTSKAAGLPNVTANLGFLPANLSVSGGTSTTGALHWNNVTDTLTAYATDANAKTTYGYDAGLDLSQGNSIYGNSTTVQPPAVTMRPYIKAYESIAKLEAPAITGNGVPVGTVIWNSANSNPNGFLLCDGSAVSRTVYPDLFDAIGTLYGSGDGSTTFNLPNLIEKFIEGGSTAGDEHEPGLPGISGSFKSTTFYSDPEPTGAFTRTSASFFLPVPSASNDTINIYNLDMSFAATENGSEYYGNSTTVQPASVVMKPFIKAFDTIISTSALNLDELISKITTLESTVSTLNDNALLKSGGTMTGNIAWTNTSPTLGTDTINGVMTVGWASHTARGPRLVLNGDESDAGLSFALGTIASTRRGMLVGSVNDSTLKWNGVSVVPYTSTAAPSASNGSNGEVWIQYTA